MIRKSPCELYIKFLLLHPDRYNDSQIKQILRLQHLDGLGSAYFDELRGKMAPPLPFYPYDKRHQNSQRFINKLRLRPMFHPTPDMQTASILLEKPRAKELLEMMIMARSPYSWIASALNRAGFGATSTSVELYRTYYWNIDLVDQSELRAILRMRPTTGGEDIDPEQGIQYGAMAKALKLDPRLAVADMVVPHLATVMNMMRLGYMPRNVDLSRIASAARTAATIRAFEATMRGGYEDHIKGQSYALMAKIMTELLEDIGSPEEDLQHQLSLMLRTDEGGLPGVHQLTGGKHTVEMMPLDDKETIDVEPE